MTPAQSARAQEHVAELGRQHGIRVRRVSIWEKSGAFLATRIVYVPREIVDPIDYLCALHEFGHILYRPSAMRHEAAGDDIAVEVTCEAAAWGWALKHVDPVVVPRMTKHLRSQIAGCWSSFIKDLDWRPNRVEV